MKEVLEKQDRLILKSMTGEPIVYDINDIEGQFYMLNRDFDGCLAFEFNKLIDRNKKGKVILNGHLNLEYRHLSLPFASWKAELLGIKIRGFLTEYGQKAYLHIEGFCDQNGNEMEPIDFEVIAKEKQKPQNKYNEHEKVALQAAEEGIVLLKNEGDVLPLKKGSVLNVFGRGLYEFRTSAVGAGKINPRYIINIRDGIKEYSEFVLNEEIAAYYQKGEDVIPDQNALSQAKEKSPVGIVVISRASGENMDNSTDAGEYYLTNGEKKLIKKITETFEKTIAILNVGYPIDLKWVEEYQIDSVLYTGFGGMLAGEAITKILDGRTNPSGKLPFTWPLDYWDNPAAMNFYNCADGKMRLTANMDVWLDTVYEEDIYVGYRYFETFNKPVLYPFGYGLSYSKFEIFEDDFSVSEEGLYIKFRVKNQGKYVGKEVIQIYICKPDGALEKSNKELVEFKKTKDLASNEYQRFEVFIPRRSFTSYSEKESAYIIEQGIYKVYIGNSIKNVINIGEFKVKQKETVKKVKNRMALNKEIKVLSKFNPIKTYPKGLGSDIKDHSGVAPVGERLEYPIEATINTESIVDKKILFSELQSNLDLMDSFIQQMSIDELARIVVCAAAGWGMEGKGEAGRIYQLPQYEMPYFAVADGNSGVNLKEPNIGMPSSTTVCASFNVELSEQVGQVIGEEAKELGIQLILAPGLNIQRNILNGRHPEYFSEDPLLSGKMAGNYCKGLEGAGVGGCYKHFIGNNAESSRKRNQSILTERAIREIYFRTFEIAMETHMASSIMTAYNSVNGIPTAADPDLILGLVREECGFEGMVMTDWETYETVDIISMLNAGNCWITPGSLDDKYTKVIVEAVGDGRLELSKLQKNAEYIILLMIKLVE